MSRHFVFDIVNLVGTFNNVSRVDILNSTRTYNIMKILTNLNLRKQFLEVKYKVACTKLQNIFVKFD